MRRATQRIWPQLQNEGQDGDLANEAQVLRERLEDGTYYQVATKLNQAHVALESAYEELYQARHKKRSEAIDDIKAHPDWPLVPEEMQESLLRPLTDRAHALELPERALTCAICEASLSEMASDLVAVDGMRSNALMRVQELTAPEEKVERVRVSEVVGVGKTLGSEVEVEEALEQLRDHLVKMLASGAKIILE